FAAEVHGKESAFTHFYNQYFNIPGFELWKFINLGLFIAIMVYLVKKPLSEAFKAKRDVIRAELIRAEQEKQAALAQLAVADAKIAKLEADKEDVLAKAKSEAALEKKRLAEQTKADIERLGHQSEAELTRLSLQTRAGLRRFSAEESIRLAEEKLRAQIDADTDSRLVKASISEIGGLN
ncbi:MAG: hypothetical protein ABIV21_04040, partial [Pyrinomonadaceae bacterium]